MHLLASYTSSSDNAFLAAGYILIGLFVVIAYVLTAVFTAPFFKKIGEPAWKAWVPVYANWTFLERAGFAGAWSLLAFGTFIPSIGFLPSIALTVFLIMAAIRYGEDFGRPGVGYAVLYAVIPVVWLGILGFGPAAYAPRTDRRLRTAPYAAAPQTPYPEAEPTSKDSSPYGPPPIL